MGESSLGADDFIWVATTEDIEIAAVDDISKYQISGYYCDIDGDVSNNLPDAGFEGFFIFYFNTAIPRGKAKEALAGIAIASFENRFLCF